MLSRKVASRCCRLALAVAVVAAMGLQPVAAEAQGTAWVGTWATAPVALPPADGTPPARPGPAQMEIDGQTLRQNVRTSIGGAEVRGVLQWLSLIHI